MTIVEQIAVIWYQEMGAISATFPIADIRVGQLMKMV